MQWMNAFLSLSLCSPNPYTTLHSMWNKPHLFNLLTNLPATTNCQTIVIVSIATNWLKAQTKLRRVSSAAIYAHSLSFILSPAVTLFVCSLHNFSHSRQEDSDLDSNLSRVFNTLWLVVAVGSCSRSLPFFDSFFVSAATFCAAFFICFTCFLAASLLLLSVCVCWRGVSVSAAMPVIVWVCVKEILQRIFQRGFMLLNQSW